MTVTARTPPPPAPRGRKGARYRLSRLLLGLILGVLCLALVVESAWFGRQLSQVLEELAERLSGEDVIVAGARVDLRSATLQVDGVVVRHRSELPERAGRTILALERVELTLGLRDGKPRLRRLEVVRPSLRLHLDEGKLREFKALTEGQGPAKARPAGAELPWDELVVREGSVTLEAQWGGRPLLQIGLEGFNAAPGQAAGTMDLRSDSVAFSLADLRQQTQDVVLRGVRVHPDRVLVPELDLAFPDIGLRGSLDLQTTGPIRGLFTLSTRLAAWNPVLPERFALAGDLRADIELSGLAKAPVMSGALLASDLGLQVTRRSEPVRTSTYALGELSTLWRVEGRQLILDPLDVRWAEGQLHLRTAIDLASLGISISLSGEELRLASALQALGASPAPWVEMGTDLEVQAAGTLKPLRLAGSWFIAGQDLVAAAGPVGRTAPMLRLPVLRLRGQLDLDDQGISLVARPLTTRRSQGRAAARIGFGGNGPLDIDFDFDRIDLSELSPLSDMGLGGVGKLRGWLGGPFDNLSALANVDVRDLRLWDLPFADLARSEIRWTDRTRLGFPNVEGQRGATRMRAAVELDFQQTALLDLQYFVSQGRLADIMGIFLQVEGVDARMDGTLELRGPVDALGGESRLELTEIDLFGERFEDGIATGYMDGGRFTLDEARIQRREGAETLLARGSVGAGWAANIDLRSDGLRLEHSQLLQELGGRLAGTLRLDAVVGGTLFEPEPSGELRLHGARFDRQSLPDSALSFTTRAGTMYFGGHLLGPGAPPALEDLDGTLPPSLAALPGSLRLAGTQALWEAQPYRIEARLDAFPVSLVLPPAADGQAIELVVGGEGLVLGNFGDQPSPVEIQARMDRTVLRWDKHELVARRPWTWEQRGEDYAIDELVMTGGATQLSFSGQRRQEGSTRFTGGGTVDLDLLRMAIPGLQRAEGLGQVSIRAVSEDGRVRPELELRVDSATLRGDWFPGTFEDLALKVRATPERSVIDEASAILGGGRVRAEGRIESERFIPRRYDLTAQARDVRVRYFDFLPAVQGDADLAFTGPSDRPLLSGRMTVRDMLFNERIDWESWMLEFSDPALRGAVAEESRDWFSMELALEADQTIRVRNNVADLMASGELRVMGSTARPGMTGRIRALPGGRVYLKERSFELLRGEVRFVDPFSYDPELDLALTTDVRSSDQSYRVDAQVAGTWSDWRTSTRSDPPLAQADINALLVFGMTRAEMERSGALGRALAVEGGDVLMSSIGIVERAEEGIFRVRGLSTLLDPLRPDRLDLVSGTSERGSGSVSSKLRLLYENDLTDVGWHGGLLLIEQNISGGRDTYIGLEQRLARRLYLRGFWSSEQEERSVDIQGAWGAEVNLRWEFD